MIPSLNRVAVLGAGTMGGQIAAHLANVGIRTLLLDLPSGTSDRSSVARQAVQNLVSLEPPPFYSPEKTRFIQVGNFEDDLSRIAECDWIIEAVVEKLEPKRQLWEQVEKYRKPGTIVSTNTSGLPLERIAEGRSDDFRQHWLGTHFFNPPRYMKLLELIPASTTRPEVVETVAFVGDRFLGKGIVVAKDTPNFIANRIGAFVSVRAIELMLELDLTIEEIDALTGPAVGRPRTGTFRLADLIGIDVMVDVNENLYSNLTDDPWKERFRPPPFLKEMLARSWKGRKSGQGFYKKMKGSSGSEEILTLDPKQLDYRPQRKPAIPSLELTRNEPDLGKRVGMLLESKDKASAFLWPFLRDTFIYSAQCVPEISEECYQIDRAMRWGYNWETGPFELWQALGVEQVAEKVQKEGAPLPSWVKDVLRQPQKSFYTPGANQELFFDLATRQYQVLPQHPEKIRLDVLKRRDGVIRSNPGATLLDLGEGVACLEFHSRMNAIGPDIVELARIAIQVVEKDFLGLVIGNQGQNFSVGANLMLLLLEAQQGNWEEIELMVRAFQDMNLSFRCSDKPVVAAPFQRVLGGGAEVCLGCDAMVAGAETYMGLVEVSVGLIPAGGGSKEMLIRHLDTAGGRTAAELLPPSREAFETVARARVSRSAEEARTLRFLRAEDSIEIHPDHLLFRAKEKVLDLLKNGYVRPEPRPDIPVVGNSGLAALKVGIHLMQRAGYISEYDAVIARKLAHVMTGGDINHPMTVTEQYLLDLEREVFLSLCGERKTQERIQHTLKTGKPLRN